MCYLSIDQTLGGVHVLGGLLTRSVCPRLMVIQGLMLECPSSGCFESLGPQAGVLGDPRRGEPLSPARMLFA